MPIEHSGGDGWTILHGDTLQIIRAFKPQVFDALITDPPYASGGWKPAEKNRTTTQKYSSMAVSYTHLKWDALGDLYQLENKEQYPLKEWEEAVSLSLIHIEAIGKRLAVAHREVNAVD